MLYKVHHDATTEAKELTLNLQYDISPIVIILHMILIRHSTSIIRGIIDFIYDQIESK